MSMVMNEYGEEGKNGDYQNLAVYLNHGSHR